jgi:hypothetical protein
MAIHADAQPVTAVGNFFGAELNWLVPPRRGADGCGPGRAFEKVP